MNIKRTYYIFKCRTHVLVNHLIERVLSTLSKFGLVVEHKKSYTNIHDQGKPLSAPDIKTERFVFSVSCLTRKVEFVSEYWFETKRGKRIFVVYENHHEEHRISYRADLKSFFAHFSPRQRMWVHSNSPNVEIKTESHVPYAEEVFKQHTCDFSQCRFACEVSLAPDTMSTVSGEVISKSYKAFGDSLTSKIPEINKILTGVDYDGEMMSPKNMPMRENVLCKKCGLPIFASAEDKYKFECLYHGELGLIDVSRVDPIRYKNVVENTLDILEDLIKKSCPQDSNL